jgi:hypothetical protein
MKRITYNGEPLITGTDVADAVVHYVTQVAGMAAAIAVDLPILEADGTVQSHTLIFSAATQLGISEADGLAGADEGALFPVPEFPPVGGQAFAVAPEAIEDDAPFLDEDPLDLVSS